MKTLKKLKYKILFIVLIIGLSLSTLFARQQAPTEKPYTIMVYMNPGDLESGGHSEGSINILKMLAAQINEKNMNVIIEIGGTEKWTNTYALNFPFKKKGRFNPPYIEDILPESEKKLPSWFKKEIDPNKNIRYKIEKGDLKQLQTFDKQNMGEKATLSSFIDYSMENFPAQKYALVFFGHGHGALKGFGYDENFNLDTLTILEMKQAFEDSKVKQQKLDFILFDTCYMANLDVAYTLKDYAHYLVASQDTLSFGTAYYKWLAELSQNPNMPTEKIAQSICDSYYELRKTYNDWEISNGNDYLNELPSTFSAIKLEGIDEIIDNIERLFSTRAGMDQRAFEELVKEAVQKTSFVKDKKINLMDVKDFCNQLEKQSNKASTYIEALKASLDKAVVYNVKQDNVTLGRANGLSIYMPHYLDESDIGPQEQLYLYRQLQFAKSYTKYVEEIISSHNSE